MSDHRFRFGRRVLLRGLGATLALPWLESLAPLIGAARTPGAPRRLAILVCPNGVEPSAWTPKGTGRDFELSPTLAPLARVKNEIVVCSGLRNAQSKDGDGHYAKVAPLLTGKKIRRTGGRDIENGVSIDQVVAAAIGHETLLPSIELGTEPVRPMEDMGYSTVYGGHIAWKSPQQPLPKEIVPRLLFERLTRATRLRGDGAATSVLDVVREDARRLEARLGRDDRAKLSEYLESVRDVERRIVAAEEAPPSAIVDLAATPAPGIPADYEKHVRLMLDLIALAFATDTTRVATFLVANEVSGRDFSFLEGVKGGHHDFSHHENKEEKKAPYRIINRWHVAQYAYLLEKLAALREGEHSLLDQSMIVLAWAMRDGNAHDPNDLPIVLAGRGGGSIPAGQHLVSAPGTPLCRLWLGLARRMGVPAPSFGDAHDELF